MGIRKITFLLIMMAAIASYVNGQCDKKLKLKTEKVYQVKADNTEGDEIPITAVITLSKDSIFVLMNWTDGTVAELKGKHTETVCNMNKAYTDGTIDFKTDAEIAVKGETKRNKMLFTVECKSGKMKVYGVPEDDHDKLCFVIKETEEIK